jgi:hypothetical protein
MYIILDCVQVRSIGQEQVRNNGPLPPGTVVDNDPVILWWERLLYTKHVITVATELSSLLMYNYNINKSILSINSYTHTNLTVTIVRDGQIAQNTF